jgi:hypothetical protein
VLVIEPQHLLLEPLLYFHDRRLDLRQHRADKLVPVSIRFNNLLFSDIVEWIGRLRLACASG